MFLRLILLAALMMACTGPVVPEPSPSVSSNPTGSPVAGCILPNDPNSHVYNPGRLTVIDPANPCLSVTGTIDFIRSEADGDQHIGLKLDPQYAGYVNSCNSTCAGGAEHGDLVVEPVCMTRNITQQDAISACTEQDGTTPYVNSIIIPSVGTHVRMTGAYVLDTVHGWNELHPLMSVEVL
jgi:hypothetical protein